MDIIKSSSNSKIKLVKSLQQKKFRDRLSLYIAEGFNILKDADKSLFKECILKESKAHKYICLLKEKDIAFSVAADTIFDTLTTTESSQGIIGIMWQKLSDFVVKDTVLILDSIRDPGNLGTILRSCLAFGVDNVITIGCCDIYNPKTVRAAMGATFLLQILELDGYERLEELLDGFSLCYLDMGGYDIYEFIKTLKEDQRLAITVGSEANGVSEFIRKLTKTSLSIPMKGEMESLNAAVSASIALSVITRRLSQKANG